MEQMKTLTKIELCNLYGWNVFRHTKDSTEKKKKVALSCMMGIIAVFVMFYVGAMSYALITLGAADVVPAYLIAMASIFILVFSIFKASGILFRNKGYDMISSLPVSDWAVVMSRFIRLYVENLVVAMLVILPGLLMYVVYMRSGIGSYIIGFISIFVTPLLPVALATGIGACITGISSRMKHKSLVEAGFSILLVIVALVWTSSFSGNAGEFTPEMMQELVDKVSVVLGKLYPLAILLGNGIVQENYLKLLLFTAVSAAAFAVVASIVSMNFHGICRNLYSTTAKHDYKLEKLQENSLLKALVLREAKRYFASSVYVTNTIIGPILGTVFCVAIVFVDMDSLLSGFPVSIYENGVLPFMVAGLFCTMNAAAVSVSMEGKEWWIVKSLPLTAKNILDSKIIFNICLLAPFYIVSEIILMVTQNVSMMERIWLISIPALVIVFSCVFGITVNLKFPKFDWESEVSVVKQSASSAIGGMGGLFVSLLSIIAVILVPVNYANIINLAICASLIVITYYMYHSNNRVDLKRM